MPLPAALFGLPEWSARLVIAGLIVAAALVLLGLVGALVPRLRRRLAADEGPRARQRNTAVSLLATALRYLVVIAALLAVIIALAGGGGLGALGGGALIVVLVGFASQRLLVDVIAGFFILFENQYGVGDVVRLEPTGYTGVVEELGLRTTVLRDLSGDRLFVPNGSITAVRHVTAGRRAYRVELVGRDEPALRRAVDEALRLTPDAAALFTRLPVVAEQSDAGDGLVRLVVTAEVSPTHEWLVERRLVDALTARLGDQLAAPPLVLSVDPEILALQRQRVAEA